MKNFKLIITLILTSKLVFSQSTTDHSKSFKALYSTVFDGDTIAELDLPEASVIRFKFKNTREEFLYYRESRRVDKIYPYYEIALKVMGDLEEVESSSKKRVYNKFKRKTKKELMNKFEKELKELTMSEGKILVKMINRKSKSNFNELIKEYLNPVKVWAYNLVAKKYGYDLKAPYEPGNPDNKYLEMVFKAKNI